MSFNKDMRLIGDYIFLHQQNYQQKGGIQEAIENQAAKRMAIINSLPEGLEQQTEQFENIISSLINPDKQDNAVVQKIWQSVEKKLQEEFPYMAKEGIDRQFLTYNHIKGVEKSIKESLETTKVKTIEVKIKKSKQDKIKLFCLILSVLSWIFDKTKLMKSKIFDSNSFIIFLETLRFL